jgi:hypothetical protein
MSWGAIGAAAGPAGRAAAGAGASARRPLAPAGLVGGARRRAAAGLCAAAFGACRAHERVTAAGGGAGPRPAPRNGSAICAVPRTWVFAGGGGEAGAGDRGVWGAFQRGGGIQRGQRRREASGRATSAVQHPARPAPPRPARTTCTTPPPSGSPSLDRWTAHRAANERPPLPAGAAGLRSGWVDAQSRLGPAAQGACEARAPPPAPPGSGGGTTTTCKPSRPSRGGRVSAGSQVPGTSPPAMTTPRGPLTPGARRPAACPRARSPQHPARAASFAPTPRAPPPASAAQSRPAHRATMVLLLLTLLLAAAAPLAAQGTCFYYDSASRSGPSGLCKPDACNDALGEAGWARGVGVGVGRLETARPKRPVTPPAARHDAARACTSAR